MDTNDVVEQFARAVRQHTATIFLGAGTSMGAKYPSWDKLIGPIRREAHVPASVTNAPLAAEYAASVLSRESFETGLLTELNKVTPIEVPQVVQMLGQLPLSEYWTTNYDNLIEMALETSPVERIVRDADYASSGDALATKRVTKMHGSLTRADAGKAQWEASPVITRGDFERYEYEHPLIWAQLKAQFLTNSFLFLGFSFDDPNIEVLLRLSRSLPKELQRRGHFATMKKPDKAHKQREFDLRIADLERSGINVAIVDKYEDIDKLVEDILRRSKAPNVFISGSGLDDAGQALAEQIGHSLGQIDDIVLSSLAGEAGVSTSFGLFKTLEAKGLYSPERIKFFFRKSAGRKAPAVFDRIGSSLYTNLPVEEMRSQVLDQCTVLISIGGGTRSRAEVDAALARGIPVIPVGSVSGTSESLWKTKTPEELNVDHMMTADSWTQLASDQPITVATVVAEAVKRSI